MYLAQRSKTKIDQLLKKLNEKNIDRVIISSANIRQDTVNKKKMKQIFKTIYPSNN